MASHAATVTLTADGLQVLQEQLRPARQLRKGRRMIESGIALAQAVVDEVREDLQKMIAPGIASMRATTEDLSDSNEFAKYLDLFNPTVSLWTGDRNPLELLDENGYLFGDDGSFETFEMIDVEVDATVSCPGYPRAEQCKRLYVNRVFDQSDEVILNAMLYWRDDHEDRDLQHYLGFRIKLVEGQTSYPCEMIIGDA